MHLSLADVGVLRCARDGVNQIQLSDNHVPVLLQKVAVRKRYGLFPLFVCAIKMAYKLRTQSALNANDTEETRIETFLYIHIRRHKTKRSFETEIPSDICRCRGGDDE